MRHRKNSHALPGSAHAMGFNAAMLKHRTRFRAYGLLQLLSLVLLSLVLTLNLALIVAISLMPPARMLVTEPSVSIFGEPLSALGLLIGFLGFRV